MKKIILFVLLVIILIGIFSFFIFSGEKDKTNDNKIPQGNNQNIIGLWGSVEFYMMDLTANQWTIITSPQQTLIEFYNDGKMCGEISGPPEYNCFRYDTYQVNGNIINVQQTDVVGPPTRFVYRFIDNKLELIGQGQDPTSRQWTDFSKIIYERIERS